MADAYRTLTTPRASAESSVMSWMPHWSQTIRFRLSIAIAATVFGVGSLLIGGMYLYQVDQINRLGQERPEVTAFRFQVAPDRLYLFRDEVVSTVYRDAVTITSRRNVEKLRQASLAGLGVLVVVAFLVGYGLSGLALRPIDRMTMVARNISGTNLTRRINLVAPDDELKRLGDTFDAMLDRLQAAFEDQRRFIQDTSHELRNPLASSRTNLDLVLSDPDATVEELRAAAEVARRSAERMSTLVDDLLTQARTGVPEVEVGVVDLDDVAAEAVADHRAAAAKRSISLEMAPIGDDLVNSHRVKGDRDALVRAASNLVSNAVRLAPVGSTVTVDVSEEDDVTVLSVTDEGPGLTPDEQANVFKRFWRGQNAGPGTGLGLSIVKQIAERHGGRVVVSSEFGIGSRFSILLPTCLNGRRS